MPLRVQTAPHTHHFPTHRIVLRNTQTILRAVPSVRTELRGIEFEDIQRMRLLLRSSLRTHSLLPSAPPSCHTASCVLCADVCVPNPCVLCCGVRSMSISLSSHVRRKQFNK